MNTENVVKIKTIWLPFFLILYILLQKGAVFGVGCDSLVALDSNVELLMGTCII